MKTNVLASLSKMNHLIMAQNLVLTKIYLELIFIFENI